MTFGLALGLAVALVVYLRSEVATRPAPAAQPVAARAPELAPPAADGPGADTPPPEARFEFYEVLPEFEVVIPEVESGPRSASAPRVAAPRAAEPGPYVLQVGSFTALADADRRQASLALLGIESRIQRVTIDDEVFHRVRIGPIEDLAEIERVRRQLRAARLDSLLIRLPD